MILGVSHVGTIVGYNIFIDISIFRVSREFLIFG